MIISENMKLLLFVNDKMIFFKNLRVLVENFLAWWGLNLFINQNYLGNVYVF